MSYQVIARKWRPQTFEDIVGQETVTRTLRNALESGRIAHAFLFSGVRGVGKTTAARILAKALNCHTAVTSAPCQKCPSCEEIREGNSVDVQEIDAASNRGIGDIRELRESVRYGTARDRFKVFIVDEVHMLTNEAFNALLKTLEEPPPHVKFILATTEYHKIPPTITSRCQKYEFKPIAYRGILQRLKLIVETEQVQISDYALGLVASVAQGSMRDAQSTLDQLIAFGGNEIGDEDVLALLGVIDQKVVGVLFDSVRERSRESLITSIQELMGSGVSPQMVCWKLIERVRHLLVCKAAGWDESLLHLPDSEKDSLLQQAEQFSELDLIRFYDVLNRTANELKWHSQPEVHLEISLLKLVELSSLRSIEDVIGDLRSVSELPPSSTSRAETVIRESKAEVLSKSPIGFARSDTGDTSTEQDSVGELMDTLQKRFMGLYQQLRFASHITYVDGKLKIRFPAAEGFHASTIEDNRGRLSETFATIVGSKPEIDIVVEEEVGHQERKPDPTEDPKVRSFIERFPGKVTIRREK